MRHSSRVSEALRSLAWCRDKTSVFPGEVKCVRRNFLFQLTCSWCSCDGDPGLEPKFGPPTPPPPPQFWPHLWIEFKGSDRVCVFDLRQPGRVTCGRAKCHQRMMLNIWCKKLFLGHQSLRARRGHGPTAFPFPCRLLTLCSISQQFWIYKGG